MWFIPNCRFENPEQVHADWTSQALWLTVWKISKLAATEQDAREHARTQGQPGGSTHTYVENPPALTQLFILRMHVIHWQSAVMWQTLQTQPTVSMTWANNNAEQLPFQSGMLVQSNKPINKMERISCKTPFINLGIQYINPCVIFIEKLCW